MDKQVIRTPDMVLHVQETKTSSGKRILPIKKDVEECFRRILENRNKPATQDRVVPMEKKVGGYSDGT